MVTTWNEILYTFRLDTWVILQGVGKITHLPHVAQIFYINDELMAGPYFVRGLKCSPTECVVELQRKIV